MCGDCWNAAMAAPTAAVAARFAWVGYKDRIPFLRRKQDGPPVDREPVTWCQAPSDRVNVVGVDDLVDAGSLPPPP
jgi:hypothetical protein